MSYQGEYANHKSAVDLLNELNNSENTHLSEFFKNITVFPEFINPEQRIDKFQFNKTKPSIGQSHLKNIYTLDGSLYISPTQTNTAGANIGIIKITQTQISLEKLIAFSSAKFPNPQDYQKISIKESFYFPLPGGKVYGPNHLAPLDFFRKTFFESFTSYTPTSHFFSHLFPEPSAFKPKTLLYSYTNSLSLKDINVSHPCPHCNQNFHKLSLKSFYDEDEELQFIHQCEHNTELYITDLLGFHDGWSDVENPRGFYTQIMNFYEKMIFINFLHNLYINLDSSQFKTYLRENAFVLDGPLALFNNTAWLSHYISEQLLRFNEYQEGIFIGIEKTGDFVEHLVFLDNQIKNQEIKNNKDITPIGLNPGFLFFLNDEYIKKEIKHIQTELPYGKGQYFGKKFYYKNHLGDLFVINKAFSNGEDKLQIDSNDSSYLESQTRLDDICWILESFSSKQFSNALSILSIAHENTAIPNTPFAQDLFQNFLKNKLK